MGTIDLSDFYLESHLAPSDYKYVCIPLWMIPSHIQSLYNLANKIIDGHVYAEIHCGMYGLPQAGRLANDQLAKFCSRIITSLANHPWPLERYHQ